MARKGSLELQLTRNTLLRTLLAAQALAWAIPASAQLSVEAVSPRPHATSAPRDAPIRVRFDRPIRENSLIPRRSFWAFGRWSGPVEGALRLEADGRTVELVHERPFSAGEMVTVFLSHDLTAEDGSRLRPGGYSFQFWAAARPAALEFTMIDRETTRDAPAVGTRAYGGVGTDLDGDGHLDITIVNEDTSDLRVFLNHGDGSGTFAPFLRPPTPTGERPSPSEVSDFDADGHPDIAVSDFGNAISILLGAGDGRFRSHQLVGIPGVPRGLVVLDADGDGDADVAHTNRNAVLSLLLNDGEGRFEHADPIAGGGAEEWALGAADMNGDGRLDLVTGDRTTERVYVYAAQGDGRFSLVASQASGGKTWMLVLGDVDGDGDADVAAVNSDSHTAALLRGEGDGRLAPAEVLSQEGFPLASDLGDLDGDGDLDWVTSSYDGLWRILRNDGAGIFSLSQEVLATGAASCALMLDVDADGDLDLALIDEEADEVIVLRNEG